jgi:hypothetical protein
MPKVNLSAMSVEALMGLRVRVDQMLLTEIEKQLEMMDRAFAVVGRQRVARGGKSRRDIGVRQAKLGQAVVQDLVGLLLRSKVERSLMIF